MQKEILLVAEAVSGEKGLPQEAIFQAIEQALATATKKRYAENSNIEVIIDPKTGDYETFRIWEVVSEEELEDEGTQVLQSTETDGLGSFVREKVENIEFGRIAAQAAKQVIVQKVREAERAQVVEKYRSVLGELVNGTDKKVTREWLIIDLGEGAEAILSRNELIPGEVFRIGDRLRAVLQEEERENSKRRKEKECEETDQMWLQKAREKVQQELAKFRVEFLERESKFKHTPKRNPTE